jgi:biotin carboxyl carrier protein
MGPMKWRVRFGDSEHRVEIPGPGESGRWVGEVKIDDRAVTVDVVEMDQGGLSLIVEGRSYSVDFDRRGEKLALVLGRSDQRTMPYTLTDERQVASAGASSRRGNEGPLKVAAPMPGKVVRVLVKAGEQVKADQGLLVVEAMKMENELRAPRAGLISEVLVREGAAVEGGATLCVLE